MSHSKDDLSQPSSSKSTLPCSSTDTNRSIRQENRYDYFNANNNQEDRESWSHYLTPEDMKPVAHGNYEYSNSYEYIRQCQLSQHTFALPNKSSSKPAPENPGYSQNLPLCLKRSASPQPSSSQSARTQPVQLQALVERPPAPSPLSQPSFEELIITTPSKQATYSDTVTLEDLEDLLCSDVLPTSSTEGYRAVTPLPQLSGFDDSDDSFDAKDNMHQLKIPNNSPNYAEIDEEESFNKIKGKKRLNFPSQKSSKKKRVETATSESGSAT